MKLALALLVAGAAASATAPPRIELDLAYSGGQRPVSTGYTTDTSEHSVGAHDCVCTLPTAPCMELSSRQCGARHSVPEREGEWCPKTSIDCEKVIAEQHPSDYRTDNPWAENGELSSYEADANRKQDKRVISHGVDAHGKGRARLAQVTRPIERKHDEGLRQPNGEPVKSIQDWTQRCEAGVSTYETCPFPVAKAWDHNQNDLSQKIRTRVFRVDLDGDNCGKGNAAVRTSCGCTNDAADKTCLVASVDFAKRSTYLFKYDVTDRAGNHAEQVVFALIIDDQQAPTIEWCVSNNGNNACFADQEKTETCHEAASCSDDPEFRWPRGCNKYNTASDADAFSEGEEVVEAGSSWALCKPSAITDNVDVDLVKRALYDVQQRDGLGTWSYVKQNQDFEDAAALLKTNVDASTYLVTMKVCDDAGVYGKDSMSNCASAEKVVKMVDSMSPVIVLNGEIAPMDNWKETAEENVYSGPAHECNSFDCKPGITACFEKRDACFGHKINVDTGARFNQEEAEKCEQFQTYCETNPDHCHGFYAENATAFDVLDNLKGREIDVSFDGAVVDATTVGTYDVVYSASDNKGNNAVEKTRRVSVVDTIPPVVHLNGDGVNPAVLHKDPRDSHGGATDENNMLTDTTETTHNVKMSAQHHTGDDWTDPGAVCRDACTGEITEVESKWVVCPGATNPGSRKSEDLAESAEDDAEKARHRLATWNAFVGADSTPWEAMGECAGLGEGADNQLVGEYIRMYRCKDGENNYAWASRQWVLQDRTIPDITLLGDDEETYDASHTIEYTDKGATCMDDVDGTLSSAVEVSGQVVNMGKVGSYKLRYDCQDTSGNQALPEFRIVHVEDKSCPEISLHGELVNYVEAGFNWTEPGYTATDDLDGDLTANVTISGDTVDTAGAFYHHRSCKGIHANICHERVPDAADTDTTSPAVNCGKPSDGYYFITRKAADDQYRRIEVYCRFMDNVQDTQTYYKCDGSDPAQADHCGSEATVGALPHVDSCGLLGLEHIVYADDAQRTWAKGHFGEAWTTEIEAPKTTNKYLCSANDASTIIHWDDVHTMHEAGAQDAYGHETNAAAHAHSLIKHSDHGAEPGKYVIQYTVADAQGNQQCRDEVLRTVIVRDTLPPVISLHLRPETADSADATATNPRDNTAGNPDNNHVIHIGVHTQQGLGSGSDEVNTNYKHVGNNPHFDWLSLMAENTANSSNVWAMAAAASAVTGLALLGFSRRTQVATSVPV